jgi:hypothetical protein
MANFLVLNLVINEETGFNLIAGFPRSDTNRWFQVNTRICFLDGTRSDQRWWLWTSCWHLECWMHSHWNAHSYVSVPLNARSMVASQSFLPWFSFAIFSMLTFFIPPSYVFMHQFVSFVPLVILLCAKLQSYAIVELWWIGFECMELIYKLFEQN